MQSQLLKIVTNFMFGKISPDEFKQLRSNVSEASDDELLLTIQTLWEDNHTLSSMPLPAKLKVLDTLDQYAQTVSYNFRWIKWATIIILPLLLTWGGYWYFSKQGNSFQQQNIVIMAEMGQKTHIQLPDGSEVWLNSNSTLSYPSDFGVKNRTVQLSGEGYFEVAKDEKTFHVETKEINVVVHGTKFNLTAHPDSPTIDVSLIEGSVSVEDSNHIELARLTPQLTMKVIKHDLQFDIIHENTSLTSLWSQSKCMVEEASAEEVFQRMSYWYGLKIQVKNDNMKQRYSFTINNESFREIIELINELTPLEYSINGEEVIIRYK